MLRKEVLLKSITVKLAVLKTYIGMLNDNHLFDANVIAEDFFARLMNATYGYSLINLNRGGANAVAIDLGDPKARVAVQVTSERNATKVQKTVDQFAKNSLGQDYDTLKILLIADRTGDYETVTVPEGIAFLGKSDVIDMSDLLRDIGKLEAAGLEAIEAVLNEDLQFPDLTQSKASEDIGLTQIDANQRELLEQHAAQAKETGEMLDELRGLVKAMPKALLPDTAAPIYQQTLDIARDLLKENKPTQALSLLEKQRPLIWPTATDAVKSTLLCRIAAAKHALRDDEDAGKLFLEARQYNPDDEKTLSNVAVGYMLLGQREQAADAAKQVLNRNPTNCHARSILIQASDEAIDQLIEAIPECCRKDCEVLSAVAFIARQRGDLATAKSWFRSAIECGDPDANPDIKAMLGEIIVHGYTDDPASPVCLGELSDTSRKELEDALSLITEACAAIKEEAALRPRVTWLLNAAIGARLLDRASQSDELISRARELNPEHISVIYQSAVWAHNRNDHAQAILFAEKLIGAEEVPHAPIFLAQLLGEGGRRPEAISTLKNFIASGPIGGNLNLAKQMIVELYMADNQVGEAQRIIDDTIATDPNDVNILVTASQLFRRVNQLEQADATLDKAVRVVNAATPSSHVYILGNELGAAEKWSDAVSIFERIADTGTDSPITRKYLHACFRSRQFDKALKVSRELRHKHGPLEFVTELEITMLEQVGDLVGARQVSEQYVAAFPNDGKRRVQLAVIYLRDRDDGALDAFLDASPDWRPLSIEYGQQLASLYAARKRHREAVELLYEMRRAHGSSGNVQLQYIQTFLFHGNEKHEWLDINDAQVNAAVGIEDANNEVQWFILEDRPDVDVARLELSIDSPLAKQMAGKKVGDAVVLRESSFSKEEGTIVEIKSKYVYAFQESIKAFEVRYPEHEGAFFTLKLPKGEKGVKELLEKLGKQEDQRQKVFRQANELYKSNPLTIGSVSRILRCNIVEAWNAMTEREDSRILSTSGIPAERAEAAKLLSSSSTQFVVDPVSLMTIHALAIADEVVEAIGRLGIVQSTIDLLNEMHLGVTRIPRVPAR